MSLRLPLASSSLRELVDLDLLASLGDLANVRKLPTYREAITSAHEFLAASPTAKSVNSLVLRADGQLWLLRISRSNAKRLWNFGKVA